MPDATAPTDRRPAPPGSAWAYWLRLGCISFGGPAGQIALMHRELVDERRWISERRFLHALNFCMLLPGPEAQQLATYMGWLMHGTRGALVAGGLFVLPSLALLIALSWLYVRFGSLPIAASILYGIKPAVVALVVQAAWRIGSRVLKHPVLWALAGASFVATVTAAVPFATVVATAAAVGLAAGRLWPQAFDASPHAPAAASARAGDARTTAWIDDDTPPRPGAARHSLALTLRVLGSGVLLGALAWAGLVAWQGVDGLFARIGAFFTSAALLSFGGAYAVLPYVVEGAVHTHGWLSPAQMMDGMALGETTPGPLIMIVAYVGYLAGWGAQNSPAMAVAGACVATFFTFLPSFVFILAGAPFIEATHGQLRWAAPLTAISAAIVGVVASLAVYFAGPVIWPQGVLRGVDGAALALALGALLALVRFRVPVVGVILACAGAGALIGALA